jgi:hypothetical protein
MVNIFVSVGTGLNSAQETFVAAVEARLRAIGLTPMTIGRNTFSADAPLKAVVSLMDRCTGTVVIALERYRFSGGVERRGSEKERLLGETGFPTAWNQIEAAMAYSRKLPLLVLVDEELRCDGLLEKGNDWYVLELPVSPEALNNAEFTGLLDSWSKRLEMKATPPASEQPLDPEKMTVGQLVGSLRPAQLWACLLALAAAIGGAFALGVRLVG